MRQDLMCWAMARRPVRCWVLASKRKLQAAPDERTRIRRAAEARQLLMPTEMGETFKFIALGRGFEAPLAAFAHQDLRRHL